MNWSNPSFDKHAFAGRRTKAVSATKTSTGWDSTGISFNDFGSMHVHRRERVQERRLPTPKWAIRDELLRELLVVYLEERFYVHRDEEASQLTRLAFAKRAADLSVPRKKESLRKWRELYRDIVRGRGFSDEKALTMYATLSGGQLCYDADYARKAIDNVEIKDLSVQIKNIDTDLVLTAKGHAQVITAIVYLYYRMGWDSVNVAKQLALKPPHIRQVLARLHATWTDSVAKRFRDVTPSVDEELETDIDADARPQVQNTGKDASGQLDIFEPGDLL